MGPKGQGGLPMDRQARQGTSPQFKGLIVVSASLGAVRIKSDNVQKPLRSLLTNQGFILMIRSFGWLLSHFTEEKIEWLEQFCL